MSLMKTKTKWRVPVGPNGELPYFEVIGNERDGQIIVNATGGLPADSDGGVALQLLKKGDRVIGMHVDFEPLTFEQTVRLLSEVLVLRPTLEVRREPQWSAELDSLSGLQALVQSPKQPSLLPEISNVIIDEKLPKAEAFYSSSFHHPSSIKARDEGYVTTQPIDDTSSASSISAPDHAVSIALDANVDAKAETVAEELPATEKVTVAASVAVVTETRKDKKKKKKEDKKSAKSARSRSSTVTNTSEEREEAAAKKPSIFRMFRSASRQKKPREVASIEVSNNANASVSADSGKPNAMIYTKSNSNSSSSGQPVIKAKIMGDEFSETLADSHGSRRARRMHRAQVHQQLPHHRHEELDLADNRPIIAPSIGAKTLPRKSHTAPATPADTIRISNTVAHPPITIATPEPNDDQHLCTSTDLVVTAVTKEEFACAWSPPSSDTDSLVTVDGTDGRVISDWLSLPVSGYRSSTSTSSSESESETEIASHARIPTPVTSTRNYASLSIDLPHPWTTLSISYFHDACSSNKAVTSLPQRRPKTVEIPRQHWLTLPARFSEAEYSIRPNFTARKIRVDIRDEPIKREWTALPPQFCPAPPEAPQCETRPLSRPRVREQRRIEQEIVVEKPKHFWVNLQPSHFEHDGKCLALSRTRKLPDVPVLAAETADDTMGEDICCQIVADYDVTDSVPTPRVASEWMSLEPLEFSSEQDWTPDYFKPIEVVAESSSSSSSDSSDDEKTPEVVAEPLVICSTLSADDIPVDVVPPQVEVEAEAVVVVEAEPVVLNETLMQTVSVHEKTRRNYFRGLLRSKKAKSKANSSSNPAINVPEAQSAEIVDEQVTRKKASSKLRHERRRTASVSSSSSSTSNAREIEKEKVKNEKGSLRITMRNLLRGRKEKSRSVPALVNPPEEFDTLPSVMTYAEYKLQFSVDESTLYTCFEHDTVALTNALSVIDNLPDGTSVFTGSHKSRNSSISEVVPAKVIPLQSARLDDSAASHTAHAKVSADDFASTEPRAAKIGSRAAARRQASRAENKFPERSLEDNESVVVPQKFGYTLPASLNKPKRIDVRTAAIATQAATEAEPAETQRKVDRKRSDTVKSTPAAYKPSYSHISVLYEAPFEHTFLPSFLEPSKNALEALFTPAVVSECCCAAMIPDDDSALESAIHMDSSESESEEPAPVTRINLKRAVIESEFVHTVSLSTEQAETAVDDSTKEKAKKKKKGKSKMLSLSKLMKPNQKRNSDTLPKSAQKRREKLKETESSFSADAVGGKSLTFQVAKKSNNVDQLDVLESLTPAVLSTCCVDSVDYGDQMKEPDDFFILRTGSMRKGFKPKRQVSIKIELNKEMEEAREAYEPPPPVSLLPVLQESDSVEAAGLLLEPVEVHAEFESLPAVFIDEEEQPLASQLKVHPEFEPEEVSIKRKKRNFARRPVRIPIEEPVVTPLDPEPEPELEPVELPPKDAEVGTSTTVDDGEHLDQVEEVLIPRKPSIRLSLRRTPSNASIEEPLPEYQPQWKRLGSFVLNGGKSGRYRLPYADQSVMCSSEEFGPDNDFDTLSINSTLVSFLLDDETGDTDSICGDQNSKN